MSLKNLKAQSMTKSPITRNTFWHCRVRFCWTTFLKTAVNNLVAVPTTLRIDFDYKLPTTENNRTRNRLRKFGTLENWSLRKGGRLREVVTTEGSTVVPVLFFLYRWRPSRKDGKALLF